MGINNYLENEVMSASPAKLVLMMYDGAINFLLNLEKLDWQKDCEKKGELINKALAIIAELQITLKMDIESVSVPLFTLYSYMQQRLVEAHVKNEPSLVKEVVDMLRELRQSFASIATPTTIPSTVPNQEEYAREGFMMAC